MCSSLSPQPVAPTGREEAAQDREQVGTQEPRFPFVACLQQADGGRMLAVGEVEIQGVTGSFGRHQRQHVFGQVAVRVDQAQSASRFQIPGDQIEQQGALAHARGAQQIGVAVAELVGPDQLLLLASIGMQTERRALRFEQMRRQRFFAHHGSN